MFFKTFLPFLCRSVISVNLKELFILERRKSANISLFSLIIVGDIFEFWGALFAFKERISFTVSLTDTSENVKALLFLYLLWIERTLGWSLYLRTAANVGSSTSLIWGSQIEFHLFQDLQLCLKRIPLKHSQFSVQF